MKRKSIAIIAFSVIALAVGGCGSDTESRNMEQIYAEEGVPVVTAPVEETGFASTIEFTAVLTGVMESSAYAAVDDKIDHIYYSVGDYVEKDSVVMTFPTDNPSANYFQAKVAYENAKATFDRMTGYFETGGLSRQDYDNARTSYEVAKANWDAVRQSVMVKAPISGTLTRTNVRESDNVQKEQELFTIARMDRLKATVWVPDTKIGDIKKGQKATALWNGIVLTGEVVQVDLSVNQARQAFGVVTEFANPGLKVRAGVTATVAIEAYQSDRAIVVGRKNIVRTGDHAYVFTAENGLARRKEVTLGRSADIDVEILTGLQPGETLITAGQMHLDDGTKIRVVDSVRLATTEK